MPTTPMPRKLTGRTYPELRYEVQLKRGYPIGVLCDVLGIGLTTLQTRLNGQHTFRLEECYKILDWLGLSDEDFTRIFPRL